MEYFKIKALKLFPLKPNYGKYLWMTPLSFGLMDMTHWNFSKITSIVYLTQSNSPWKWDSMLASHSWTSFSPVTLMDHYLTKYIGIRPILNSIYMPPPTITPPKSLESLTP